MGTSLIKSLSNFVSWTEVMPALGVKLRSHALPCLVDCPVCKAGGALIFHDPMFGGQWHTCRKCKFSGNMIELAAKTWKLDTAATILKLRSLTGTPASSLCRRQDVEAYISDIQRPAALLSELETIGQNTIRRPNHAQQLLLNKAKLRWTGIPEAARESVSKVVGVVTKNQAVQCLRPHSYRITKSGNAHVEGKAKWLKGRGWSDLISIPLRSVPGRVDGFWLVGRNVGPDDVSLNWMQKASKPHKYGGGFAFHSDLPHTVKTLIAVRNPLQYLRAQIKSLRSSSEPPPYILHAQIPGMFQDWSMFPTATITLWEQSMTDEVLLYAYKYDAKISLAGPRIRTDEELQRWMAERTPDDLRQLIEHDAMPWHERLEQLILKGDDSEVENLMLRLKNAGNEIYEMLRSVSGKARERAAVFLKLDSNVRQISLGGMRILEQDGMWLHDRGSQLVHISDAIIRIEKIITYKNGRATYVGHVLYRKERVNFCADRKELDSVGIWLQDLLVANQKGIVSVKKSWEPKLLTIAAQFHEPQFLDGIERVGWDESTGELVLPRYRFGSPSTSRAGLGAPEWFSDLPAVTIPPPKSVDPVKLEDLAKDTPAYRGFWTVASSVAAFALGPGMAQETPGMVLTGSGSSSLGRAAMSALGVPTHEMHFSRKIEDTWDRESAHDWPLLVLRHSRTSQEDVRIWAEGYGRARNCFVALSAVDGLTMAIAGGWQRLWIEPGRPGALEYGPAALSAYFEDWFNRLHNDGVNPSGEWVDWIREDMIEWAARNGVDLVAAKTARALVVDHKNAVDAMGATLLDGIERGLARMVRPEVFDTPRAVRLEKDGVWIPETWHQLVRGPNGGSGSVRAAEAAANLPWLLSQAGVLLEQCNRHDVAGYLVDTGWWRKVCQKNRSEAPTLKIVS